VQGCAFGRSGSTTAFSVSIANNARAHELSNRRPLRAGWNILARGFLDNGPSLPANGASSASLLAVAGAVAPEVSRVVLTCAGVSRSVRLNGGYFGYAVATPSSNTSATCALAAYNARGRLVASMKMSASQLQPFAETGGTS